MTYKLPLVGLCLGLAAMTFAPGDGMAQKKKKKSEATAAAADTSKKATPPKKKASIGEKTKSSRKIEGIFTFYQDTVTGSLQMYIKKDQLDKPFVYQSFSINGPTSLFLNQSMHRANFVFEIKHYYDKLEFSQVNTNFYYDKNNAVSKTQGVDIAESVFFNDKIAAEDDEGYLVSIDGLMISDKMDPVKPLMPPGTPPTAVFNLGNFNSGKSKYYKVNSYATNAAIQVDLAYDNPMPFNQGGKDITDARFVRVRMQHTFIEVPQNNFRPRLEDPRIGYFTTEVNDQTTKSATPYKDRIHRWYLEKKDPGAALSEPVKPIVWYVENTTPLEYRQTIVEAGEKWNEAFEKAGFKNAVVMKIQPDTATWDAADVDYNVIRWVASATPSYGAIGPSFVNPETGQILGADITVEWATGSSTPIIEGIFSGQGNTSEAIDHAFHPDGHQCTMANELKAQFLAGATLMEMNGATAAALSTAHKQFLYYLILHEMGHTLGLNHNMKSSQMWSMKEINDTSLTHKYGLIGSVMDYPAINIALDPAQQGDYYTTKPGPYDLWAIEYGYVETTPQNEEAILNNIASRSTDPKLAFGNDADDMRSPGKAIDPRVMINDLTSDAIDYAAERFQIVNNLMGRLRAKYSKPGQSYQELRSRFGYLQNQRVSMTSVLSRYIGGVYIDRSFVGQNTTTKPFTPVPAATQKKAMQVLSKYIFAPDAFKADEVLYPYLQMQRRGFNFFTTSEDPKITSSTRSIQGSGALAHLLHPVTMQRITNTSLYGNEYSVADMLSDLTKAIFAADMSTSVNVYRQYLQNEYVEMLCSIPASKAHDDVAKGAVIYNLKKIRSSLASAASPNEATKAHRANLVFQIDKALAVK
ncbi:zinc-dependent metalloprotease [Chitinophaga caeni]|nr:zinc-dependent metalloprotease [Chitinophaga caeni]